MSALNNGSEVSTQSPGGEKPAPNRKRWGLPTNLRQAIRWIQPPAWTTRWRPRLHRVKPRQTLAQAHENLAHASEGIEACMQRLETSFLQVGGALQEMSQNGQEFLKKSERLVSIAVGQLQGREVIINSAQVVEAPLQFLDDCLSESEHLLQRLREDHQSIKELQKAESNLRSTMAPLRFMQTLFKIESAPLGAEAQIMFSGLTQEIERLHTQVCELFDTKFRELEKVQAILNTVGVKLEDQTARLRHFVTQEKSQIQQSLEHLSKELASNQVRDVRIQRLSREISQEIQEIIVGLQFQDIINQKLQHTRTAVAQILERAGKDDESLHFIEQSCRLEASQIQAVRQDLARAEKTIRDGVQSIQDQLTQTDTDCLTLIEFEHIATSADGMIQVLLELIESARKQVIEMTQRTDDIHQQLLPIYSLATGMTAVVRELSHHIHLIGLNAQIQAGQFSHGAGLEVLSARTSEISTETNTIAETISQHLDQVASGLTDSVKAFDRLHTQAAKQLDGLSREGTAAEMDLHALRDEALMSLDKISGDLELIKKQATHALTTIHYTEAAEETLQDLQNQLEALAETAHEQLSHDHRPTSNVVTQLRADYTMASERHVFDQLINQDQAAPAPTPAAAPPDDIEFFDSPTPPAPVDSADSPEKKSSAEPPTDSTSDQKPNNQSGNNLGDNIEFF